MREGPRLEALSEAASFVSLLTYFEGISLGIAQGKRLENVTTLQQDYRWLKDMWFRLKLQPRHRRVILDC